jgi:hypothetical protein
MRLRPFFSFYGSKWQLGPLYPVPKYDKIVELFAGSAGYSLAYSEREVVLCDVDPIIVGVWDFLIRAKPQEILRLPAVVEDVDPLKIPEEAKALIGFWLGRCLSAPRKIASAWNRTLKWPTCFWGPSIRERIARQVDAIKHWRVLRKSWEEVYSRPCTWFIDPPYERQGRFYRYSDVDFAALGAFAKEAPGQVLVCENEGATWLPFQHFKVARANSSRGKGRVSREVLWQKG